MLYIGLHKFIDQPRLTGAGQQFLWLHLIILDGSLRTTYRSCAFRFYVLRSWSESFRPDLVRLNNAQIEGNQLDKSMLSDQVRWNRYQVRSDLFR